MAQLVIDALQQSHPLIPYIKEKNTRYLLLLKYLALCAHDKLVENKRCVYCFSDPNASESVKNKNHKYKLSQHLFLCEPRHHVGRIRCNICGDYFEVPSQDAVVLDTNTATATKGMTPSRVHEIELPVIEHFEECLERLLQRLGLRDGMNAIPDDANSKGKSVAVEM